MAATVALTGAVLAAAAALTESAVEPSPPPGAYDEAGRVATTGAAGAALPYADVSSAESEDSGDAAADARPSPSALTRSGAAIAPEWLDETAERTGIPRRALEGYAGAQLHLAEEHPGCQLSWPTLAGIGWVESHHGTYAGGEIGSDGTTTVDIIGVPLDGGPGVAAIPDTDGGELDGDTTWDRAVGPMQFIPETWQSWGVSAEGGGDPDPHNIDDAALSAAYYLCADGRDLTATEGWHEAVLSYNRSEEYAADVLDAANRYAAAVYE